MSENTLAGRPIRGTVSHYSSEPTEQRPVSELIAAIDRLFTFDEVESIRWRQSTPYFNDGDPCEFGVHEPEFRITGVDEEAGDHEDGYLSNWDVRYGNSEEYKYNAEPTYPQISPELAEAIKECAAVISGGAHEIDLRKHFGDPSEVIATRDGFDVEFYDHD